MTMPLPQTVFTVVRPDFHELRQHAVHVGLVELVEGEERGVVIALELNLAVLVWGAWTEDRRLVVRGEVFLPLTRLSRLWHTGTLY